MDYIEASLGLPVKSSSFFDPNTLPRYLTDRYQMTSASIGEARVVFVRPKAELEQTASVAKHISRIEKCAGAVAVLVLHSISYYRRKTLIEGKISFVIPNKQLYLPFLGTYLQRPTDTDYTQPETMQPSSQVLLLYYIYRNKDRLYISDAVQELGYSAMTISRAARQLVDLGLMLECKNGVQKIIYTENSHRDLFQQALPYLSTPVKRECYVSTNTNLSPHLLAGISALAEHSMLNPEHPICYGMYYKAKIAGTSQLIDARQQYKIQLWKYDPELFRTWMIGNTVDSLSLYLSLNDHPDERIEEALEEYIENFWEVHNGHRN